MREQRILLEHRVHRALVGRHTGDILALEQNFAGIRLQKACDQAQGRGLAAAGRTQQRNELFVMDIEVQSVQNALAVKLHYDVPQ